MREAGTRMTVFLYFVFLWVTFGVGGVIWK